jgi:hypothetical protein
MPKCGDPHCCYQSYPVDGLHACTLCNILVKLKDGNVTTVTIEQPKLAATKKSQKKKKKMVTSEKSISAAIHTKDNKKNSSTTNTSSPKDNPTVAMLKNN